MRRFRADEKFKINFSKYNTNNLKCSCHDKLKINYKFTAYCSYAYFENYSNMSKITEGLNRH